MPSVLCVLGARPAEPVLLRTLSYAAKSTYCKIPADKGRKTQHADRTIHLRNQNTSRQKACRRGSRWHHACPGPGQFRRYEIRFRLSHWPLSNPFELRSLLHWKASFHPALLAFRVMRHIGVTHRCQFTGSVFAGVSMRARTVSNDFVVLVGQ